VWCVCVYMWCGGVYVWCVCVCLDKHVMHTLEELGGEACLDALVGADLPVEVCVCVVCM